MQQVSSWAARSDPSQRLLLFGERLGVLRDRSSAPQQTLGDYERTARRLPLPRLHPAAGAPHLRYAHRRVALFTRPMYSSMSFGLLPAASILVAFSISVAWAAGFRSCDCVDERLCWSTLIVFLVGELCIVWPFEFTLARSVPSCSRQVRC